MERQQQLIDRLQRSLEADRSRPCAGGQRLPDQVVADKMREEFVANAMRRLAAEMVHL